MKVADLLKIKGHSVVTVAPDEPVFFAMQKLIENHIGSLVVCSDAKNIVGIISERDVMRAAFRDYDSLKSKKVSDLMTTNLLIAIPDDDIGYIMGIMTNNRIRHVPIVSKEEGLVGIVSIGDIVKYELEETQVKNRYLEEYLFNQ